MKTAIEERQFWTWEGERLIHATLLEIGKLTGVATTVFYTLHTRQSRKASSRRPVKLWFDQTKRNRIAIYSKVSSYFRDAAVRIGQTEEQKQMRIKHGDLV